MALFVAKFLESTFAEPEKLDAGGDGCLTADPERESPSISTPVVRTSRISLQALDRKLKRMYAKNFQRQQAENIQVARSVMAGFVWGKADVGRKDDRSVGLLKLAEPSIEFDSSRMDLVEYVGTSVDKLNSLLREIQVEAKAKEKENERLKMEMRGHVEIVFDLNRLNKIATELQKMSELVSIDLESLDVRKGEFLEGVLRGLNSTSIGETEDEMVVKKLMETRKILSRFEQIGLRESSCYRVLTARFGIVMTSFCDRLVTQLQDPKKRREAYVTLLKFRHKKVDIESKVLSPWMKKFEYHFVRVGSVLNEPDKPEWPLKWFLETAKEIKEEMTDATEILVMLARFAREYFDNHRWALIRDPSEDGFSLYLSKYLEFARFVKDQMGERAMNEYMRGFELESEPTKHGWFLLHEWIRHDRRYFETVLDGVKDSFAPSKIDPTVNELTQTLIDMFTACRSRLEPLAGMPRSRKEFVTECCDHVVRCYVLHAVRVKLANDIPIESRHLIMSSVQKLIEAGTQQDLLSPQLRKLLSELINELE